MILYEIPGPPIPLQRHRHSGKNTYDPQKKEKEAYRVYMKSLMSGLFPASIAIKLTVEYHMPIPKSYSKKKHKECVGTPHFKKPDLSNLIKFTEDAFNQIVWKDDSIIAQIEATKLYSENPKTVFKIKKLSQK